MQVRAVTKFVRVQPRKVRIVAAEVKGKPAIQVANVLYFHTSKGAFWLRKTLVSAIANAVENHGVSPETLKITGIQVDEGPRLKRIEQRAMGRGNRIVKKMSHITVVVEDAITSGKPKPHGTKEKPRPKFAAPKRATKKKDMEAPVTEPEKTEEVVQEAIAAEESLGMVNEISNIASAPAGISEATADILQKAAAPEATAEETKAEEGKE